MRKLALRQTDGMLQGLQWQQDTDRCGWFANLIHVMPKYIAIFDGLAPKKQDQLSCCWQPTVEKPVDFYAIRLRRFFAALKTNHSNSRLDEVGASDLLIFRPICHDSSDADPFIWQAKLQNLYRSSGKAFKPNLMAKASLPSSPLVKSLDSLNKSNKINGKYTWHRSFLKKADVFLFLSQIVKNRSNFSNYFRYVSFFQMKCKHPKENVIGSKIKQTV